MDSQLITWMASLGAWNWFILAALLFLIEIFAPGSFMLWLGLSAIVVGVISVAIDWSWQAQLIAFAIFALASIPAWRHFARKVEAPAERPFLNRRAEGYVGREVTLDNPIIGGSGTLRIDDTVWRVRGPDCPAGSRVKIVGTEGGKLLVTGVSDH